MKNLLVLMLALASSGINAATTQTQNQIPQPKLALNIFDFSTKVPRIVQGHTVSIKAGHQVCWAAFDMPFQEKNKTIEIFKAPAESKFVINNATVVSSKDKLTHTITSQRAAVNNEYISNCWQFDNTDPKGRYEIQIQVNDAVFPVHYFDVVE